MRLSNYDSLPVRTVLCTSDLLEYSTLFHSSRIHVLCIHASYNQHRVSLLNRNQSNRGLQHHPVFRTPHDEVHIASSLCRYDVKYGSAGFNTYGYKAGCAFAAGGFSEALEDPAAARYLCAEGGVQACTHDSASEGVCRGLDLWEAFNRTEPVRFENCI